MKRARLRYILDANGNAVPCSDAASWKTWFETADRELATAAVGPFRIGTYFMGLDHGLGMGDPVLWETIVLSDKGGWEQPLTRRYTTREAALNGHTEVVSMLLAEQEAGILQPGYLPEKIRDRFRFWARLRGDA